jgi:hypothetical protein
VEEVIHAGIANDCAKHAFGKRRSTDVAKADEKNSYGVGSHVTPRSTGHLRMNLPKIRASARMSAPPPRRPAVRAMLLAALAACTAADEPQHRAATDAGHVACGKPAIVGSLPDELADASAIAISRTHAGVLWVVNNTEPLARVFAIDSAGRIRGIVQIPGADNLDWEDLAAGPCAADEDDGGNCLYIADIGDNFHVRDDIGIYRVREPQPGSRRSTHAEWFPVAYPEGPQDAEAMFVLPDARVFIITKGRNRPVSLYRYPPPLRAGETVLLQLVQELSDGIVQIPDMVTGAGATPDGRFVAVRTYSQFFLYTTTDDGRLEPAAPPTSLAALDEAQGEGADIRADGVAFLTGERGVDANRAAPVGRVPCRLPDP